MSSARCAAIAAIAAIAMPVPAAAQDDGVSISVEEPPLPDPEALAGDQFTIGAGLAYGPDYEGSDDYRILPGAIARGQVGGISFITRGLKLYVDLAPKGDGNVGLDAGPIIGLKLTRTGSVDDVVVDQLPDRKTGIEVGAFGGISISQLTNPYDKLSFRLDAVADVNGAYSGWNLSPNLTFATPLSRRTYVSASAGLDFASGDYMDTYFGITPAESLLVPALPAYDPDGGGLKSWKVGLLVAQAVGRGDLLGGFQLFGTVNYSRLVGDAADSPLVADRGSASQWFLAAGLGYTF